MSRFVLGLGSIALAAIMAFSTPDIAMARGTHSGGGRHHTTAGHRMNHGHRYHRVSKAKKPRKNKQASHRHHRHRGSTVGTPPVRRSIG
ncbi:MAG TPA: hypothetical protein VG713_07960 [Pirellulales bacterium]|nr:hypothetical protein [Pirellulales bacterium]